MHTQLMFIHCLSPLHAGVGQSVDVVDLAIARERSTGFPILPGSSIKGALRDRGTRAQTVNVKKLFGPETDNASEHAGALAFGDGNLLFLPVRSVKGTFAYVTSPYLLQRLNRDLVEARQSALKVPALRDAAKAIVPIGSSLELAGKVYFEDLDFTAQQDSSNLASDLAKLMFSGDEAQRKSFESRFCIVADDVMVFLAKHGTDVVTRVSLDADSKTAKPGQLWTEENLPSESILFSLVGHMPFLQMSDAKSAFKDLESITKTEVQFGGKATVGRGRCRITWARRDEGKGERAGGER